MKQSIMIDVEDVKRLLDVADGKAYEVIRMLNNELKAKGYFTINGRVPFKYFCERVYGCDYEAYESEELYG